MKSKTSFCNSALLKKNFSRFAVIWGLFFGTLILTTTVILLNLGGQWLPTDSMSRVADATRSFLSGYSVIGGTFLNQLYGIVCAVACFGYLHKTRSAYMMHAFPMNRGTLFNTSLISGVLFALVPQLAVMLLNFGAVAINGSHLYLEVLQAFGIQMLEFLFSYGLGVFCMVLTGQTVFGILSYFVLNYIVVLLELVIRIILTPLMFGVETLAGMATLPFSPTIYLTAEGLEGLDYDRVRSLTSPECWRYLAIIAAVGIVLMLLSRLLYAKRDMENAGEVIAFRWAKPIFKYFFTVCVTLFLGLLITVIAATEEVSNGASTGMIICLLIAGLIGYFAAEMMLKRTLRVFNGKAFIGFAIYAAILLALLLAVKFDIFGVVNRVPAPESVKEAKIEFDDYIGDGGTITLTDPEDIEALTKIHKNVLETHKRLNETQSFSGDEDGLWVYMKLSYDLNNGTSLKRNYDGAWTGTPDSEFIALLDGKPELLASYYDSVPYSSKSFCYISNCPDEYGRYGELSYSEMQGLRASLQKDIEAGTIRLYEDIVCFDYGTCYQIRVEDSILTIPQSAKNACAYIRSLPEKVYR